MLAGPHIAVGAMIGRSSRRAWIALPLAFVSHYLLDAMPHAYLSLRDPRALPLKAAIVAADALIGLALVFWITRRQSHWRLILGSAFAAVMLDLMNPVTSLGKWLARSPGTAWLISVHIRSVYHVPFGEWLLGFGPSIAVLALVAVAAWLSGARRQSNDLRAGLSRRIAQDSHASSDRPGRDQGLTSGLLCGILPAMFWYAVLLPFSPLCLLFGGHSRDGGGDL